MSKGVVCCLLLTVVMAVLFSLNILVGSISIPVADVVSILMGADAKPSWQYIILESRLPQAMTALLAGGALAVSGLMLQTAFRNPLAGPSIFGINSGAGLGVALVMAALLLIFALGLRTVWLLFPQDRWWCARIRSLSASASAAAT